MFTNRRSGFAAIAVAALLGMSAQAATYSWLGTTGDPLTNTNWSPTGVPTTGDTINMDTTGMTSILQSGSFATRFMNFNVGVNAYTWSAGATNALTIGSGSSGTTRGEILNNSSNTQVINMGTGTLAITGTVNGTGDIVINGGILPGNNTNSSGAWLDFVGTNQNVYINVDSSIHPSGNSNAAPWLAGQSISSARANTYFEGTGGRVFLGNIGTAYLGRMILDSTGDQAVRLTHNNALGGTGGRIYIGLLATAGGGAADQNSTLELAGNISVTRGATFLEPRSGVGTNEADPHILNVSGNNTYTMTGDWNTSSSEGGNWNLQSDSGKLTIAGGNFYSTAAAGSGQVTLQLRGAGDGAIEAPLLLWNDGLSMNVVKSGSGSWSFSSVPVAFELGTGGATDVIQPIPTANQTSIFTGTFAVDAGTLEFKPLATGNRITLQPTSSITVADGAKLKISQIDTVSTAVTSSSSLALGASSGASIDFSLAGTPAVAPLIVDSFTTAGTNTVNVSSGAALTLGQFALLDYNAIGGAGFGGLSLGSLPPRVTANLVDNAGNTSVDLNVTAIDTIRWKGNVNANWNINTTANWVLNSNGTTPTTYLQPGAIGDSVTFDDTAAGNFNVNLAESVSPGSVTFNNTTNNYTLSGTGGLTTGTLTKNGAGTASIANSGAFSASAVALNAGVLEINRASDTTLTGVLTGIGTLRKINSNALTLTGDGSGYSGTINVNVGTLKAGSATAIGTGTTVVASGATIDLNGQVLANGNVSLTGTGVGGLGALYQGGASAALIQNATLTGDTTIAASTLNGFNIGANAGAAVSGSGVFQGNGKNLTVIAPREIDIKNVGDMGIRDLVLGGPGAGDVVYLAGDTTLGPANNGAVVLKDLGRLGFYGADSTNGEDSHTTVIDKPITVDVSTNGGGLEVYRGNQVIASPITLNGNLNVDTYIRETATWTAEFSGPISGAGNLAVHANGTSSSRRGVILLTNASNTYMGTTTIGGGGGLIGGGVSATNDRVTLAIGGTAGTIGPGDITLAGANANLSVTRSTPYTLPNLVTGAGRLMVDNPSAEATVTNTANSFTGSTYVRAGHLIVPANGVLGPAGSNTVNYIQMAITQGASPDPDANTAALVLTNNVTLTKAAIYTPLRSVNVADLGPHIISASGSNEMTGTIATDSAPDGFNIYYTVQSNGGSNLKISGNIVQDKTGEAFLTLRGVGTGEVSGGLLQPAADFFSGAAVSGNVMSVIKEGTGTWTISGTDDHTGTTTVNDGTLLVNTTHSVGGAYTVNSDTFSTFGKLGGTGTIIADVTVNPGGTLAPGASVGTLTVGSASFNTDFVNPNGKLQIEYNNSVFPKVDQLVVANALDITNAILDFDNLGANPLTGTTHVIAAYGSLIGSMFSSVLDLPSPYTLDYNYLGLNQIAIVGGPPGGTPGDYNNDGKVNAADYVLWRKNPGAFGGPGGYDVWRANFGNPPGAGSGVGLDGGAVPEPATCGLVLCAMIGALCGRRRLRTAL